MSEYYSHIPRLYNGKKVFHVKHFQPALGFWGNLRRHRELVTQGALSPYYEHRKDPDLLTCVIRRVQTPSTCPHFLTNTLVTCKTCRKAYPCVYCHEDAFVLEKPHDLDPDTDSLTCAACENACGSSQTCSNCKAQLIVAPLSHKEPAAPHTCSICQTRYDDAYQQFVELSCGHGFHAHCWYRHAEGNGPRCPVCQMRSVRVLGANDVRDALASLCGI